MSCTVDRTCNGLLATESVDASGSQHFSIDVSSFVACRVANGETSAGFNVREEPANGSNFLIMNLDGVDVGVLPELLIEYSSEQRVEIDIKPGSDGNSINLCSEGVLPVAILSSADFDAITIDPETVRVADASVKMVGNGGKLLCHDEDVDGDGSTDLLCQVVVSEFAVPTDSRERISSNL